MRHIVIGDKDSKEEDKAIKSSFEEDDETDGYFSGYAHFGIHHDMISVLIVIFVIKSLSSSLRLNLFII